MSRNPLEWEDVKIDLETQVKGMLPQANGGTGAVSPYPSQEGCSGMVLGTDGKSVCWTSLDGGTY